MKKILINICLLVVICLPAISFAVVPTDPGFFYTPSGGNTPAAPNVGQTYNPMAAQTTGGLSSNSGTRFGYFDSIITGATGLLRSVLIFLIALAVCWFIWNVIKYAMSDDEEGKGKAKSQMIWGIVAIAVMVSVWGLVALLQNAFGLNQGTTNFQGNLGGMIPSI